MRAARKSYMSDITDEQWELLKGFIPAAKPGGRPRKVEVREVVNAIFYILSAGCPWRMLPHDFPVWQTVYEYFRNWRIEKIWEPLNRQFNQWVRVSGGKDATPSVAITDSQSVQIGSTQSEPQAVGCDGGKKVKGRKRHILVDTCIRDKLRSDRSCQAGLRRWLKEKLVATTHMFREGGNNQLDIRFADCFDNTEILIFRSSKIFNWVRS